MALTKASEYDIAVGALALVLLAANFILWVITLLKCRRRGDPSRRGLSWMKLCAPLYSGYLLFLASACAMEILFYEIGSDFNADDEDYRPFLNAARFLNIFARLFVDLTGAFLFLTLMHFGMGILYARSAEAPKLYRPSLLAVKATTGILVIIAIALLGVSIDYTKDYIDHFWDIGKLERFQAVTQAELEKEALTARKLSGALTVLVFIVSVVSFAFAAFVLVSVSKTHAHLRKSAVLLLIAAVLYFEQNLCSVVITGLYFKFDDLASALDAPEYILVLVFIFETVPLFLIFFFLFLLGKKKQDGLWSGAHAHSQPTLQQYPQYQQHQQQPQQGYMYGNYLQGQQQMDMGWQQQQQPQYGPPPVAQPPPMYGSQGHHLTSPSPPQPQTYQYGPRPPQELSSSIVHQANSTPQPQEIGIYPTPSPLQKAELDSAAETK